MHESFTPRSRNGTQWCLLCIRVLLSKESIAPETVQQEAELFRFALVASHKAGLLQSTEGKVRAGQWALPRSSRKSCLKMRPHLLIAPSRWRKINLDKDSGGCSGWVFRQAAHCLNFLFIPLSHHEIWQVCGGEQHGMEPLAEKAHKTMLVRAEKKLPDHGFFRGFTFQVTFHNNNSI